MAMMEMLKKKRPVHDCSCVSESSKASRFHEISKIPGWFSDETSRPVPFPTGL